MLQQSTRASEHELNVPKNLIYNPTVPMESGWLHTDEALAVADRQRQVVLDDAEVTEAVRCASRELDLCPTVLILQAV
jgi:hypothetical protein